MSESNEAVTTPTAVHAEPADRRGSPIPTWGMISTRFLELRKRRGLMIALAVVTIGIPTLFMVIRLLLHAFSPKTYGPAGGYDIYTALVAGVLYTFGFIVAATLGATAGSDDLSEGMFRHQVITGRSRLALYFARIPAGLAILVPMIAVGFAIVCAVCVFAAPTSLSYNNVSVPANLSKANLETWAGNHANEVICNFNFDIGPNSPLASVIPAVPCGAQRGRGKRALAGAPGGEALPQPSQAQISAAASTIAAQDFDRYSQQFLKPSTSLMVDSWLWLELEGVIGFIVGLGLASLIGQRTIAVVALIVLEIIVTPIFSRAKIPHFVNIQRAIVGLATAHLAPNGLPVLGGGGGGPGGGAGNPQLIPETTLVAACVIVAWLVVWTILGAWRMATREA